MRRTVLASAVSLAALLAAPASAALSDFRLPGDTQRPPEPERVGPVAPDVPESRGPAPTPPPARQPTRPPASQPSAEQPAIIVPELPAAAAATSSPRTAGTPAEPRQAPGGESVATATPEPQPIGTAGAELPEASAAPSPFPASTARTAEPAAAEGGSFWPWALGALAALAALALGAWAWQRRRPVVGSSAVPQLERPRLAPIPATTPAKAPADTTLPEPLQVTLDPLRLSLTLMNATLAYHLEVANRGATPIVNLAIGADMICAHASMSREQQLSGPGPGATTVQRIDRLEPGESRIVEGEFRVPFTQIVPIRQGNAALLLPLARFRLAAEGAAPVVRTFAVGQPGAKSALQPFRLDLGPRVYPTLTQRAFA